MAVEQKSVSMCVWQVCQGAFDRLLKVIKSKSGAERDQAKSHLISLFNLVDPTDARLIKARAALASALF